MAKKYQFTCVKKLLPVKQFLFNAVQFRIALFCAVLNKRFVASQLSMFKCEFVPLCFFSGGFPSNEMLKARVQIFNDTFCQELYKKHNHVITDSMLCAGYINGNIDSCVVSGCIAFFQKVDEDDKQKKCLLIALISRSN